MAGEYVRSIGNIHKWKTSNYLQILGNVFILQKLIREEGVIMKTLIDRLIEFDNELIKSFEERYPKFTNFCIRMYNGKKFGYQLMDESGDKDEYTITINNNCMTLYEQGIENASMISRFKISFVEETLENYSDGFLNRPLRTLPRYMVKCINAIAIGDMKFGKKK